MWRRWWEKGLGSEDESVQYQAKRESCLKNSREPRGVLSRE